ncbi:uncharacterized protein LOC134232382, partial [Saccostrea cucullata]|uniref:uncharacterized protein LOC134232382 n=1 Tax=Saccostrea cuccullata TaxID=36930 RepID=UPI002ED12FC9
MQMNTIYIPRDTRGTVPIFGFLLQHTYPCSHIMEKENDSKEHNNSVDYKKDWINKITNEKFCRDIPARASLHHDVRYGSFGLQQDYKSSGYEYSTTTEKHTKYKTQIIFITVISCLIVLGAGGAFFISLVKWNHYHDDTPQNHFEMVQAKGQMRIQQDFTEELNNKTSLVYLNFTHDFCEEITTSIKWDSLTILRNCAVTGLR